LEQEAFTIETLADEKLPVFLFGSFAK